MTQPPRRDADPRWSSRVSDAVDRVEIDALISAYGSAIDVPDFELLETLFTPDATIDLTPVHGHRPYSVSEFLRFLRGLRAEYAQAEMSSGHLFPNRDVRLRGDDATALLNSITFVGGAIAEGVHLEGVAYTFDFRRGTDGWRISALTESLIWVAQPLPHVAREVFIAAVHERLGQDPLERF